MSNKPTDHPNESTDQPQQQGSTTEEIHKALEEIKAKVERLQASGGEDKKDALALVARAVRIAVSSFKDEPTEEPPELKRWLDRLFEQRTMNIILSKRDSEEFLRIITITQRDSDKKYDISSRRTCVEIELFDGRKVSIEFSTSRENQKYSATWKPN